MMSRALDQLFHALGCGFLIFAALKAVEMGPFQAAALVGQCVHVFIVAVQGYL
jgi:hypothetical protein